MIVRNLADLENTERDVRADTWKSRRLLLADDKMGFSLHDTVLYAGTETEMEYQNHFEAVYCIEGKATIENCATGEVDVYKRQALPKMAGHPQAPKLALTDRLPRSPGVYLMRNAQNRVIYVGKATNLRSSCLLYTSRCV